MKNLIHVYNQIADIIYKYIKYHMLLKINESLGRAPHGSNDVPHKGMYLCHSVNSPAFYFFLNLHSYHVYWVANYFLLLSVLFHKEREYGIQEGRATANKNT